MNILNPWIILGGVLIWLASLAGVGVWQNHTGHTAERVAYQARDNQMITAANANILAIEEKYRAAEKANADLLAAVSINYEKRIQHADQKTADLVAANRAGDFRLRDPKAPGIHPAGSLAATAAAGAGIGDATQGAELSVEATEFLLGLTGEADKVVEQLTACQQIVRADRGLIDERTRSMGLESKPRPTTVR